MQGQNPSHTAFEDVGAKADGGCLELCRSSVQWGQSWCPCKGHLCLHLAQLTALTPRGAGGAQLGQAQAAATCCSQHQGLPPSPARLQGRWGPLEPGLSELLSDPTQDLESQTFLSLSAPMLGQEGAESSLDETETPKADPSRVLSQSQGWAVC